MAVESPLSRYKKTNLKVVIALCLGAAVVFGYDGYLSRYKWSMRYSFYRKHVLDNGGMPTSTMNFNRKSPPFFLAGAVLTGAYFFAVRRKKVVAGESGLAVDGREEIAYSSIEKIDKTHFGSKGYFVMTYRDSGGRTTGRRISNRKYDNLQAVLDEIVRKISGG